MEKRESYECQVSRDILSNSNQVIAIQINVDRQWTGNVGHIKLHVVVYSDWGGFWA